MKLSILDLVGIFFVAFLTLTVLWGVIGTAVYSSRQRRAQQGTNHTGTLTTAQRP